MKRGITGYGAYLPRWRLARGAVQASLAWLSQGKAGAAGERSYCHWDEDALTMAVEAARDCLATPGLAAPEALWLASTSLPFADRSNSGLAAAALDLAPACHTLDSSGSLRAGTSALRAALEGAASAVVVASDARAARPGSPQELGFGHGAAAIAVGAGPPIAEYLGAESIAVDFVDHYREAGADFDYALEERWIRDEGYQKLVPPPAAALLKRAGVAAAAVDRFVMPAATAIQIRLAAAIGIRPDAVAEPLHARAGDTGTAHPLLMLADALATARAGATVLVIGFGQGVDALLFRTTAHAGAARPPRGVAGALAAGRTDTAYTRYLSHQGLLEVDFGMRAERDARTAQSVAYRRRRELAAFVGGRCSRCGTLQFPKARACVNPQCRAIDTQHDARLAELDGRVKSYTEDWLAYTPSPPLVYGNVEVGGAANVFMEFTDVEPGELAVGTAVRMVYRIKDVDRVRGFRRYFWKATPVRSV